MARFDPAARLPLRLQSRLDAWYFHHPRSQFSMYGPINVYLQCHKFPSDRYLVKPQSKLQEEAAELNDTTDSDSSDDIVAVLTQRVHRTTLSTDSYGAAVASLTRYIDFTICQYWGDHESALPDKIRVLLEIGWDRKKTVRQLQFNLDLAGGRWEGRILGVGIVNTHVVLIRNTDPTGRFRRIGKWISLYDDKFIQELDRIIAFCEANDPEPVV